ncbi:fibronectin isoform X5 [Oncorhynchus mykiss]|uniref:fibronectin isoform X5 n=1 Tax=Oncorhynchus mykiss TaxID=8022 RepID=UPI001878B901|nr:fibronectin isoform X5 [Oncorhynchus mykiss]
MSYHQGAEGGAITKERHRDGSPNKDLDETVNPDMRGSPETEESISSGNLSMKSGESMDIPISFKGGVSLRNKGPVEVPCDICSEVQAVKFCLTCSVSYCETHIRQHYTIAALQRHTLVDVTGDQVQKLCQHDYSPLEVFCRTYQMMICSQCAETIHKGHDTTIHEKKKAGTQTKSCDGDQDQTLTSYDVPQPPGEIQFSSLTSDSVSLNWGSPEGLTGPQKFRVTWEREGEKRKLRVKDLHKVEISGLKPGEKYKFNVSTEGEDGKQSRCVSASIFTVVQAPMDLTIEKLQTTSLDLCWSKAQGMEGIPQHFLISYCSPGTETQAAYTENCYKTLSDLRPGSQYTISVSTVLNNGEESEPVSTAIYTIIPAPVGLNVYLVDTTSAAVSWNQPPGLDQTQHHYQISYRCPGTEPHIATTSSHSITLSDLQGGTQYSVTVCTVLENGSKSLLVSTTFTTGYTWLSMLWTPVPFRLPFIGQQSVLPAPDQLTVDSVDTTSAAVSWNQPPGLDQTQHHYQISYHCPGTEPHITTTSTHSITLSDLQGGTQYSVTVCTVLENGMQSQLVSTTLTTVLPAPDQLTVDSLDTTSAAVSWSQSPGLDQTQHQYQISYHCPGTEPHITTTSSHSITLSDLQCGTQYSVTVCTVLENGKQSQLVSTTLKTILPAPDQLTVDSVDTTSAAVSWNQPPGLDQTQHHYQISYHCPGTEPHITTTSSHSITLSELQGGTQYSVTVCTVLENGKQSQLVSTTLTTVLPAPDQLTVDSVDTTSAAVSWSQPPGLDQTQHHYQISYHCPGTEPHITTTSSHSITLSDLKPATQYSVSVCTVLENGKQSQLLLSTLTTVLPAPDQLTVDSVDTTSAAVSWSQPPGLDQTQHHYQISYHCPGTEPHITITSSPSITLHDLKPATQYSVSVCTVLENGWQSQLLSTTLTTAWDVKVQYLP